MAEEILNLVEEFKRRRPAVVHAWQDSTSIKVGIAAVIAGVPRIVLASRNLTPVNFGYYQEYMRSAYQALSEVDSIIFLNNSSAGAVDYCRWLEIPQDRFQVVRNGVDLGGSLGWTMWLWQRIVILSVFHEMLRRWVHL